MNEKYNNLLNEHEKKLSGNFIQFWIMKEIMTFNAIFTMVYNYLHGKYIALQEDVDDPIVSISLIDNTVRVSRMIYIEFKRTFKGM